MLKSYLKRIYDVASRGDAREESYYSTLEDLLKEYAESINKKNIHITTLPKKTEAGNPDFRVWDGKQHIVGYIEAKSPTIEHLDQIETTEQLERYLSTFPNVMLTNFFEFRLYRNGTMTDRVAIARPYIIHKLKTIPPIEKAEEFFQLLEKFLKFSLPKLYSAKDLAIELAKRTKFLREEVIAQELKNSGEERDNILKGFFETFKDYLIGGLTEEEFADLYSQTITYGLFAARTRSGKNFSRRYAYDYIPSTIGILRDVFKFISFGELPQQMEWTVDDIAGVLAVTDVRSILHKYFHEGKGKDPIVHFYETFLSEYDPKTREQRGVYYTPESVVSYIVRSLNQILKKDFDRKNGFGSDSVTVLDPAAGTLTFVAEATKLAIEQFVTTYGDGGKKEFIKKHILNNFYAFELMMAPYAVGHLKVSLLLEELGYRLTEDQRFKFYLTNALEIEELSDTQIPLISSLSRESHLAGKVKKDTPILVILGNPPYSGHSANASEKYITIRTKKGLARRKKVKTWIGKAIDDYKFVDGQPLMEKTSKWLQDDYVKFIRFAQWKIEKAGEGVLGFITNHSYIDSPTFRGMRQSLMKEFGEIRILDLHGSTLRRETCPDGSKDENVFDIRPGVAIALFVKKRDSEDQCKVYFSEIWGVRKKKYHWLSKHCLTTTKWQKLSPKSPFYLFVPREEKLLDFYSKFPSVTEIFSVYGVGMTTARDTFIIDKDKNALLNRIRLFKNSQYSDGELHEAFNIRKKKGWSIRKAWDVLQSIPDTDLKYP
jgi:type I restriction-modification system DNA methylase subunit